MNIIRVGGFWLMQQLSYCPFMCKVFVFVALL